MNCSRAQGMNKRLDFSASRVSMQASMLAFVKRRGEVSLHDIQKHFSATPKTFVIAQVDIALADGTLLICRATTGRARANCAYRYAVGE